MTTECPKAEWIIALDEIADHSNRIACDKGWRDTELTVPHVVGMVVSELCEMMEIARNAEKKNDLWDEETCRELALECADAIIRLLDFAHHEELPVGQALYDKMKYNEQRPYRHGDKPF